MVGLYPLLASLWFGPPVLEVLRRQILLFEHVDLFQMEDNEFVETVVRM